MELKRCNCGGTLQYQHERNVYVCWSCVSEFLPTDLPPQEFQPHGMPPHGTQSYGMQPHGTQPHGMQSHGTPSHWTPPHGTPPPPPHAGSHDHWGQPAYNNSHGYHGYPYKRKSRFGTAVIVVGIILFIMVGGAYLYNRNTVAQVEYVYSAYEAATDDDTADEVPAYEPAPDFVAGGDIIGTWYWMGSSYYVFEGDGTGTMTGLAIRWETDNGVLSICSTPRLCRNRCLAPMQWYYVLDGDGLTLTSTAVSSMSFNYTR